MTHSLWNSLSEKIYEFLEGITLGDLIENSDVLDVAERQKKQKESLKLVS
jgi:Rrf2 family iron-sulfur cluster assembly transcriptional regulator